ncbi:MAG: TetR/AcrR family transcriptional regulator [Coriobacteriales bacterium]|jgi:AcrR family transcriptional regulator|nr:TetR/AcrR family transcriptional regulator [Coriobacteriales bacterium]
MIVRQSIQNCFRELALSTPYEDISVTRICKETGVSRASFYDSFQNKETVLSSIVQDDVVDSQHRMLETIPTFRIKSSPQILMELIYQSIADHERFYSRINRVEHGSLLVRILTERLSALNDVVLKDFELPDDEKAYTAFFFSAANASLISRWLTRKMDVEPTRLAHLFNKWTLSYWQKISPVKQEWME